MKNEKQTLIILTPGFPADEADSTCLPLLQSLVTELKKNYPQLDLVILAFHYPFVKKIYKWKEAEVISFNGFQKKSFLKLLLFTSIWKKLKKIKKEENVIGLLSLWLGECAWIGKRFSKKYGLKHYCWLWGQDAKPGNKYVNRIQPSANELIALSNFLQSEFEKNYSVQPAHLIPPGIDAKQYDRKNNIRDIDVLGVGSLIPLKQYNIFIDVVKELKNSLPNIKTLLCGKGPEEIRLQQQIEKFKLKDNVTLIGEVPHHEVIQLMQRSKILLHPSSYEGFGLVCMEALYAGAQVVSFCKPMDHEINHWHIVKTQEEMRTKCVGLMNSPMSFEPVMTYNATDMARSVMKLFGL